MHQAAPFQQIEKDLAICPDTIRRSYCPMNGLSQAGVVDERPILFRICGGRDHVLGYGTSRRRKQVLHDQKRYIFQRGRLLLADPTVSERGV